MSNNTVVKVENVSKKFTRSLKHSMLYGIKDIARNMVGLSAHSERLRPGEFWALDNISFELKKGETLGIIGPNGAGKTTLLKLLNGIFNPDEGKIRMKGKVGALIQIGAGFHPLLTGKENIYINGSILGMSKKEIDKKLHSIIDFADIGDFIDSPVKYYSSGMYVRLGFAIAIHCNPDILLVDEILAVGDVGFQTKCLQRMKEVKDRGTSIIFISHNLESVNNICLRAIFLHQGKMKFLGSPLDAISLYRKFVLSSSQKFPKEAPAKVETIKGEKKIEISKVEFINREGIKTETFKTAESMTMNIYYFAKEPIDSPEFRLAFYLIDGTHYAWHSTRADGYQTGIINGRGKLEVIFPELNLMSGEYLISVLILDKDGIAPFDRHYQSHRILVEASKFTSGIVYLSHSWKLEKL